jgi:hypothetical protein
LEGGESLSFSVLVFFKLQARVSMNSPARTIRALVSLDLALDLWIDHERGTSQLPRPLSRQLQGSSETLV